MFYSAPASPYHQLFSGHQPPSTSSWSSQASHSPSPSPRASPSPQREMRGRGGVFATLFRPEQRGRQAAHQRQGNNHRGHAGDEARRHSLVGEQQQVGGEHQRRHSLGLVMTTRPNEGESGRELPTILESPGFKPYVGFEALHISESPSRPLTDLESALQKLENEGKPVQDFESALGSYREGLAVRSSPSSRGSGSFDLEVLESRNAMNREGKPRPVSVATVGGKFDGQYRTEKYFDKFEACNNFDRLESGKNMGTGKYFDNLVAMIEGSMRGLEL